MTAKDEDRLYHEDGALACRAMAEELAEKIRRLQADHDAYTRLLTYHLGRLRAAETLTAKQREASHGSD